MRHARRCSRMTKGAAFAAYQLAGRLLLGPDDYMTPGQRERLEVLLLDVLSEPERFTSKLIVEMERLALAL